jgi:hypothetical protein
MATTLVEVDVGSRAPVVWFTVSLLWFLSHGAWERLWVAEFPWFPVLCLHRSKFLLVSISLCPRT